MKDKICEIANHFGLEGEVQSVDVVSNGHINSTYDVTIQYNGENHRYIFQKLNIFVFKNPKKIMGNIARITKHISSKLEEVGESQDRVMHFYKTPAGKNYHMGTQGFWRISDYVPNTVTYNECDDLGKLRSAGTAFGEFQTWLSDFDAADLYETIPHFHDTRSRIAVLLRHINEDPCGRAEEVAAEIEQIREWRSMAVRLNELVDSQELPLRVTHNDTKMNNLLFDQDTHEAKTVIDLDTVMPGLVAHDFGDAVRYAANVAAEDEPDTTKVALDMDRFRAFAEGFVPPITHSLEQMEIDTLALGAFTITVELAVRFLDDYITGDRYFKIGYPTHNLVRARCQLALAKDMFNRMDEMNRIVAEIAGN